MPRAARALLALLWLWLCVGTGTVLAQSTDIEIPYERYVLSNGLRVIVHEDRKAPIVAVGVWYHVGSKDEPAGKTGFAHLFEHLMFESSEHFDGDITRPLEAAGATSMNGTTGFDRTHYFETVPTPALELALWLESDRMGHLLGAVTQDKLDQERGVVENEKRQGDNEPYGRVYYRILEGLFPPGHPYRHSTIGSMEDLQAASLQDVHRWFGDFYGAANTVLVLAGDIAPGEGRRLAEKYFGHIPPGPPPARLQQWVPERREDTRETLYDRVPQSRSFRYWAVPGWNRQDVALLDLAAAVLGRGKNARLYQALVHETRLAVEVEVDVQPFELAGLFSIDVTLAPDASLTEVDEIIEHELARLISGGPRDDELLRARSGIRADRIRGLEQVGGFDGKASTLAEGELYDGNPAFFRTYLSWIETASADEVRRAARRWLGRGRYQLDVLPFPDYETSPPAVDRDAGLPAVGKLPDLVFPPIERMRLSNGLEVVFARRDAVPVVQLALQFDAGYAADFGRKAGTASFALSMMDESTESRSALEIDAEAEALGAIIGTASDLDTSRVQLSALAENLEPSIALFADIVRNPAFAPDELERQRMRWLAAIERERSEPVTAALRTLPPLLYGPDHPYGTPFTGTGTEKSVAALERGDLLAFHAGWIRPERATLIAVGGVDLDTLAPMLEAHFGNWRPGGTGAPSRPIAEVPLPPRPRLLLVDRPGAPTSLILAAHLAPSSRSPDALATTLMNDILGGDYLSRVNQNLRVDKQWSYGAYTFFEDALGQRPFLVYAPVQADRTAAAIAELQGELERFLAVEPARPEELERVYRSNANSLPGRFETAGAVLELLLENARLGRPDDWAVTLKQRLRAIGLEQVQGAAERVLRPNGLTWVVIGDRSAIETPLRELDIAEIEAAEVH